MFTAKKHAADDDFESPRNVITESNVDYLSYKFDEMDLAASWRVLTKQKLSIVNGIRLENASWRTWAKQRNNLKTISPDTLNWLKDSDVTWLYGPLHTVIKNMDDEDKYAKPKVSTTEETLGLIAHNPKSKGLNSENDIMKTDESTKKETKAFNKTVHSVASANSITTPPDSTSTTSSSPIASPQRPLKSALKKVTMSDLLKRSASELQINTKLAANNGISISQANQQLGAFSPAVIANHRQPKLRFNQYVEQCIALYDNDDSPRHSSNNTNGRKKTVRTKIPTADSDRHDLGVDENEDEDDDNDSITSDDYDPDEDSDEDDGLVMRRNSSSRMPKLRTAIKKIEPTLLKTNSLSDEEDSMYSDSSDEEDMVMMASSSSHRRGSSSRFHVGGGGRRKSASAPIVDADTWEAESAESDAFVNHIIQLSQQKRQQQADYYRNRDPAADKIPTDPSTASNNNYNYEDGNYTTDGGIPTRSDYDYEFDDDDWDTHSEHVEDDPFSFHTTEFYPPVSPSQPVGCYIAPKSAPTPNAPVLSANIRPKVERSLSHTNVAETIQHNQQQYDGASSDSIKNNDNNTAVATNRENTGSAADMSKGSSLFSSIANWASTHLWPSDK
ncbi:hypothetical protein BDF20DRAFT_914538 [Mycotypha africana]|uniref:uncharacterized protein n=1 Tax=Mycotypha africana TaxID=64632 RepID=UPI0023018D38|nr:uncharacterized protein BDF20DRAFT_914538 [Mycotypha africana]KAI8975652.1 hypothetical protein BDF20DRAFT_914538 [Mycotypha africana]